MYTEEVLVCLLRKKNSEAINYVYKKYGSLLYGKVNNIFNDDLISSEVFKNVFIVMLNTINSYDSNNSRLFTWMSWIANDEVSKRESELLNIKAIRDFTLFSNVAEVDICHKKPA